MSTRNFDLRGAVLGWTILTTTFAWTPTMRLLLKPEISHWSIFGVGGVGSVGPFWILPLVATAALLLFYVEGRGRLRPLFHGLLLAWHLPITASLVYWSARLGADAAFMGAAWGVTLPFPLLAPPFALFSALAVLLVIKETRGSLPVPSHSWRQVNWFKLSIAGFLFPVAAVFFRLGEGFDSMVLIAIVATVLQWILLVEALGRPGALASEPSARVPPQYRDPRGTSV